jgi:hypothetical protein
MDLALGLVEGGGGRKGFSYRLAMDGARETELGVVAGIIGLGAVAGGLTTSTDDGGNRAWAQIAKRVDLAQDLGALSFESRKGIGQEGSTSEQSTTPRNITHKKKRSELPRPCRAPPLNRVVPPPRANLRI